jgi:hypothetical protein
MSKRAKIRGKILLGGCQMIVEGISEIVLL